MTTLTKCLSNDPSVHLLGSPCVDTACMRFRAVEPPSVLTVLQDTRFDQAKCCFCRSPCAIRKESRAFLQEASTFSPSCLTTSLFERGQVVDAESIRPSGVKRSLRSVHVNGKFFLRSDIRGAVAPRACIPLALGLILPSDSDNTQAWRS